MTTADVPVFGVAVASAVLLAAAGVTLAVVPGLRRRRVLRLTWLLGASMWALAVLVNLVRLMHEFT